jgi:DNA-binding transcriptional LysR family regulator
MNDDPVATALDALVPRLRQFIVVGCEEHLTRAAEALGVPQPTLGTQRRTHRTSWVTATPPGRGQRRLA